MTVYYRSINKQKQRYIYLCWTKIGDRKALTPFYVQCASDLSNPWLQSPVLRCCCNVTPLSANSIFKSVSDIITRHRTGIRLGSLKFLYACGALVLTVVLVQSGKFYLHLHFTCEIKQKCTILCSGQPNETAKYGLSLITSWIVRGVHVRVKVPGYKIN